MPFVFVHGVNTRKNAAYEKELSIRDGFLKNYVGPAIGIAKESRVFSPYWGGHGVNFRRGLSVIPTGSEETFGATETSMLPPSVAELARQQGTSAGDRLRGLAQSDPSKFIDAIFDSAMEAAPKDEIESLTRAFVAAHASVESEGAPWSQGDAAQTMASAVYKKGLASRVESFGTGNLWDLLKEGVARIVNTPVDVLSHAGVQLLRRPLTTKFATFLGDSFVYLNERQNGQTLGPIGQLIADDLIEGAKLAKEKNEPLVVICHSFGGEIVYDLLTHYLKDEGIQVDTWVTVGSQVGLFEEMSLYLASDPTAVSEAIAMPAIVQHWLNVVDTNDVLAFAISPVFEGGEKRLDDFKYDTGAAVTGAHSGYWQWPSFYRRLRARLSQEGGRE